MWFRNGLAGDCRYLVGVSSHRAFHVAGMWVKLGMMGSRGRGASKSIARCALQSLEAVMGSIGQPGAVPGAWQHADNDNKLGGPAKPAPCMQPSNKFTSEGNALKMGK